MVGDCIAANDSALRLRHRDFNNLASDYVPLRSENLNCGSPRCFAKIARTWTNAAILH